MAVPSEFSKRAAGEWRILALDELWNARLQERVLALVRAQAPARHPQTIEVSDVVDGVEARFFLKVFHRSSLLTALKDQFRLSRAFGSWRQGMALAALGFNAPSAIAVGKQRGLQVARREFILTARIDGMALTTFLSPNCASHPASLSYKRDNIRVLARLVRRFHDAGFVHGDLVASNLFLRPGGGSAVEFYFMDNDRTRRYPSWLPQPFWRRNLIQLNRMPLPGISLQDRMRFLHAYLDVKRLSKAERRFAHWLEARTRQRRKECDGADTTGSFRRLMRWTPEIAGAKTT
jgi:hypothetical protein